LQEANRVDDSVYFVTEPVELRLDGANVNAIVKSGHRTFEFECPINTFLASFANSAVLGAQGSTSSNTFIWSSVRPAMLECFQPIRRKIKMASDRGGVRLLAGSSLSLKIMLA
jgi:hypothetical protein